MIRGVIFDFNRTIYDPDTNQLNSGAINILEDLLSRNYKLCLLSKKTKEDRREQISSLGLDKYFLHIGVVDEMKTEQDMQECLDTMSLAASEVMVVGDRIKSEIALGKRMGMKTIWYNQGKFSSELPSSPLEEPDYIITRLEEVLKYL